MSENKKAWGGRRPKAGRTPLPPGTRLRTISLGVTQPEKDSLTDLAAAAGTCLSSYLRLQLGLPKIQRPE